MNTYIKVIEKVITFMIYFNHDYVNLYRRMIMSEKKESITPMEHYNMSDFLRGQASKIITSISEKDKTGFVLKHGKPLVVIISNERYERLLKEGIDINEY